MLHARIDISRSDERAILRIASPGRHKPVALQCRRRSILVNRATRSLATALVCAALGAPALAHANPQAHWKIPTGLPPMTLHIALGLSNLACQQCQTTRGVAPRSPLVGSNATVTGWTQPLGVRLVLRW